MRGLYAGTGRSSRVSSAEFVPYHVPDERFFEGTQHRPCRTLPRRFVTTFRKPEKRFLLPASLDALVSFSTQPISETRGEHLFSFRDRLYEKRFDPPTLLLTLIIRLYENVSNMQNG